jgi:hypothetical protein
MRQPASIVSIGGRAMQWLRQKNGGKELGFGTREQLGPKSTTRFLFEIHVGKGLPIGVSHHETAIQFLDGPWRREVACSHGSANQRL